MKSTHFIRRLNIVLSGSEESNKLTFAHNIFRRTLNLIVLINISSVLLSPFNTINAIYDFFLVISFFSAFIFTIEYILRIYSAPARHRSMSLLRARFKYVMSFMGVIDFISILPFIIPYFHVSSSEYIYINELAKVCLIFKLARYSHTLKFILNVFKSVYIELLLGWTVALSLVIFSGILMYYVERDAQPDVFYNAGQGLWWSIITFATVGYGDITPVTGVGKLIAGIIAMIGIGMLALPAGIISSAFIKNMDEIKGKFSPGKSIFIKSKPKSTFSKSEQQSEITSENQHQNNNEQNQQRCFCPYCGAKLSNEEK